MLWRVAEIAGQHYPSQHYSTSNGLSHANVFRIQQDHRGFIWFSTNSGLSRFDGSNFHNYAIKDGLTDNCIMSVAEMGNNTRLISTLNGGLCLQTDSSITPFRVQEGRMPARVFYAFPMGKDIWLIAQDYTAGGLYRISGHTISKVPVMDEEGREVVFHTAHVLPTRLLLASSNGIYLLRKGQTPEPYLPGFTDKVTTVIEDKSGNIWAGLTDRIIRINNREIVQSIPLPDKSGVADILEDRQGKIWFAVVGEGVCTLKNNSLEFINPLLNITTTAINDLAEDHEGNIWVATHGMGAFRISGQHILHYPVEKGRLNVYCESIFPFQDQLFVGSIGNISIWDKGVLKPFNVRLLHSSYFVYSVQVIDRELYIGTSNGLIVKQLKAPYSERLINNEEGVSTGAIALFRDRYGHTWVGGYRNFFRIVDGLLTTDSNYRIPGTRRFNTIMQSESGSIWIGTDKGIILYNGKEYRVWTGGLKHFPVYVEALYEDSRGRMWIGSRNGLFVTDGGKILPVPIEKTGINDIREDKNKVIWLATGKGLKYIQPGSLKVKDYYTGVYSEEVSALYIRGDTIFAGTTSGMLYIRNSLSSGAIQTPPPVYITAVATGSGMVYMPTKITLPYQNSKLVISFVGLDFESPDRTEYRYRIEGLDNAWHVTDNNSIELPALPDGRFSLSLQARNRQSAWSESITLPIHVVTPLWKTKLFMVAAIIAISLSFFLIIRTIITRQERRKRTRLLLYNKMAYLKQQALSALINPHFIFNCMNSIQHYLNEHDNDMANEYLSDFAGLIRMTMEHSTEAFIDLEKEIKRISLYVSLEQLRFGEDLHFSCVVDPGLDSRQVRIPNMVLQPYLENAIWHGIMPKSGVGNIHMHVGVYDAAHIIITIQDDGVGLFSGRQQKQVGRHRKDALGMKLIDERMMLLKKLLKQEYTVQAREVRYHASDDKAAGTLVEIIVPVAPEEAVLLEFENDNREDESEVQKKRTRK